jgi:iron complex outermembrane receptor protein
VNQTRNRGVEFVTEERDFLLKGLELSNSVTYVNARIVSDPGFVSAAGTSATGKHVPYVPDWRDTTQVTYRWDDKLALSAAARYSGKMYSTLDNTDTVSHVMGAFDKFFVVDAHVHYQFAKYLSAGAGIDNLFNKKYFEYHPFPGRTYVADLRLTF